MQVPRLLSLVCFVLRKQVLTELGRLTRTITCILGPLTFTLNVPAVITIWSLFAR